MLSINTTHSVKSELKNMLAVSIPFITAQLIYACSGFIGTALVSKLGPDALAASVLVSMIWMSLSVLFFGLLNSVCVLVSHQYGAKNHQAISEIMGKAFLLGALICLLMFAVFLSMPLFLRFTSQPPIVIKLSLDYMHALLWTIPGLTMLVVCEQFLAGINRVKIVLRISLLVVPIEIPLIYLLIFGKLGFPRCGVAGIGYGFAITYTLTAIALLIFLLKAKTYRPFAIFSKIRFTELHWLKELVRVGLPMGCMHVIEVSTFTLATFWIARFGTTWLAAHQIVMQFLSFSITVVFAMSQAVTVRVGHAVGRQDLTGVRYAIYVGMLMNFCCMAVIASAFILFPDFFLRLDLNIHASVNTELVRDSAALLSICSILMLFDNFRIIGFGALRGLKDTKFPMYASFIAFWIVGLSSAYLFGFVFHLGTKGIWWGLTFCIISGALIVFVRIQYLLKRVDLAKIMGAVG